MTARLLAFRALLALLLATIGLQAVPAHSVGVERHRGSAFDISAFEVATAAVLRSADHHEARLAEPDRDPEPPALLPIVPPITRGDAAPFPAPSQAWRTPSPGQDIACLASAPRAPPFA